MSPQKTIGVALGGGGAKGVAHIAVLETIDELGINLSQITGTSVGAVLAVLYASGISGKELRRLIEDVFSPNENFWQEIVERNPSPSIKWYDLFSPNFGNTPNLLNIDGFFEWIERLTKVTELEELKIPVKLVAADFWGREQVVFEKGSIKQAVHASMALPGIVEPVRFQNKILVDGGSVNPVPFDLLDNRCDFKLAVDVLGTKIDNSNALPGAFELFFNTYQIMEESIVTEKLKHSPIDCYFKPNITDVRVLEINKYQSVFEQVKPEIESLKEQLKAYFDC